MKKSILAKTRCEPHESGLFCEKPYLLLHHSAVPDGCATA